MTGVTRDRLAPGTRLGDYTIEGDLEGGWNIEAYLGRHAVLPRRARLVVLHPAFAEQKSAAVQLLREACLLEAVHHAGVPRVHECGVFERRPWIAFELIEGVTVASMIKTAPLPVHDVAALLRDAAEVLAHAHRRGVIHRNLRADVLVRTEPDARGFPLCITGWSDARVHDDASAHVDARADVLSLGAIAFTALTLARPTRSAAELCPGAPPALTALIDRMRSPLPEARPTCAEVRAEAIRIAEHADIILHADDPGLDGETIDEVAVELVELPRTITPASRVPRWTPALGNTTPPQPLPAVKLGAIKLKPRE